MTRLPAVLAACAVLLGVLLLWAGSGSAACHPTAARHAHHGAVARVGSCAVAGVRSVVHGSP